MQTNERRINAFSSYSWNRLVETLLKFKETLSKAHKEWDTLRWQEICGEMRHIQAVMADKDATYDDRLVVVRRLIDAPCRSLKISLPSRNKDEPPVGVDGTVSEIHCGIYDENGLFIPLPHVTFKVKEGDGYMRHRLEEIKLITESWWFSHSEHKRPKN